MNGRRASLLVGIGLALALATVASSTASAAAYRTALLPQAVAAGSGGPTPLSSSARTARRSCATRSPRLRPAHAAGLRRPAVQLPGASVLALPGPPRHEWRRSSRPVRRPAQRLPGDHPRTAYHAPVRLRARCRRQRRRVHRDPGPAQRSGPPLPQLTHRHARHARRFPDRGGASVAMSSRVTISSRSRRSRGRTQPIRPPSASTASRLSAIS